MHWSSQISGTTNDLNGVAFADPSNGWVAGNLGTILHTMDGGLHWSSQKSGITTNLVGVDSPFTIAAKHGRSNPL